MNTTISEIFPMTSDEDVESIIDLHNAVWDEMLAHRVPTSTEEFRVRRDYPNHSYRFFAAKGDTGVVVGVLTVLHFNDGTNPPVTAVSSAECPTQSAPSRSGCWTRPTTWRATSTRRR